MFGGAGDVMIESSCIDFGDVLLLPIFWGRTAMDRGLGEGSTGEPKGFLRAGWNRVLMMLLYAMVFFKIESPRGKSGARWTFTESYFLVMQGINILHRKWSEPHMREVKG